MICPFCGKEMETGTLPPRRDKVVWCREGEDAWTADVVLSAPGLWKGIAATAHYCADCRKVIVELPEYESLIDKLDRKLQERDARKEAERAEREAERAVETARKEKEKKRKKLSKDPWED